MPIATKPRDTEAATPVDPVKPQPVLLKDEAFIALERMIVIGQLAPGQWVSEKDLMDVSGHSRASVRHAVQRLEDQQLVKIFPRRGAQIGPMDYQRQFRLLELRRVVEALVAGSAAKRASREQKAQFERFADGFGRIVANQDHIAMIELDLGNYSLMLEAADNPFASKAMAVVKGLSRRFWVLHHEKHGDVEQMARCHQAVAAAIAAGDPEAAEQAVSRLVDYVETFTLRVVGYNS